MNYIAIAGFILAFAVSAFGWNYRLSAANRIYLGLYKGVAEDSVITIDETGRELSKPYISVPLYKANVSRYLESNSGALLSYRFDVFGFDERGLLAMEKAYKVTTIVVFKISLVRDTTRTAVFTIQEGRVE